MKNETVRSNVPKTAVCARRSDGAHTPGEVASLHYHDELEFLPIYEGKFCCTVDGKDYIGEAGDVIFVNSAVPHSTSSVTDSRIGLLQFREGDYLDREITRIVKYSVRLQGLSDDPVRILRDPELFSAIDGILTESERQGKAYEIFIKSGIYRVLGLLYRGGILSDGERIYNTKYVQKILPALAYINENYSEDVTLEEVAAKLNFDRSYFCRIFKLATGATFTEYLNFVRVCRAEKLLARTRDSILDVSAAVGFSSVSYFNRIFKKYRNCSPRYYRTAKYCNNL